MTDSTPEAVVPAVPAVSMSAPEVSKAPKVVKSSGPSRVVGRGSTDEVSYGTYRAIVDGTSKSRKALPLHHLQARLVELGYPEAGADLDGRYGLLTARSIEAWQKDNKHKVTGDLTPEQFAAVFNGDSNITVVA